VIVSLFLAIFLPFGNVNEIAYGLPGLLSAVLAVLFFLIKVILFYFVSAVLENAMARVRFLKASAVTWTALAAAVLSFVFYLANV
jgi:formate hydrogenlyase subunit 4